MFVYIVRCNFTTPEREAAWNAWYSGPKIEQMLAQPYFLTGQRFSRAAGVGRDYLALWTISSPEALKTREYKSQWGFAEWERDVTDWSRDLFDGGDAAEGAFAVRDGGVLQVVAFDGGSAEEAGAARAGMRDSGMHWLPVIDLDRHTPLLGLRALAENAGPPSPPPNAHAASYRPICPPYGRR